MAKINLLPWREELRNQRNQTFAVIAALSAGVGVLIIIGVSTFYNQLIDNQESRNQFMQNEVAKLDKKISEIKELKTKKERLLQRIATIQQLQTNRTEIVHLFYETVVSVPEGVYLTSLAQAGDSLTMTGIAESNTRVSEFVRNIEQSKWMQSPRIDVIKRNKNTALQTNDFTLRLRQSRPASDGEEQEDES